MPYDGKVYYLPADSNGKIDNLISNHNPWAYLFKVVNVGIESKRSIFARCDCVI